MFKYKTISGPVAVAGLTLMLALGACSGGGDAPATDTTMQEPTPYEKAKAAIAAAETAEDAQAAYDAVKDDVTAAQGDMLQAKVDARIAALEMMARADEQRMALADAAGMIDTSDEALSTQDGVNAARAAIAGLRQAIADAADVDDTSMYQSQLEAAAAAVDEAQGGIDTDTRRTNQMMALSDASMALQTALTALAGQAPTQEQIDAASAALADLNSAIEGAADLTADETATYQREADNAAAPISTAQSSLDDADDKAEKERQKAEAAAAAKAAAAMAVTASKLHAGIGAPNPATADAAQRQAVYSGTDNVDIRVTWGAADTAQSLKVDKDASVEARNGWTGQMFTASPDDAGTYEAVVYSHVGEPTEGVKFNDSANGGYTLDSDNKIASVTVVTGYQDLVASASFDQSAGTKTFDLAENREFLVFAGTFNGVPGTYTCTPTDVSTNRDTCGAEVAASGFTLSGGTWTFKPNNPEARLMETPDNEYASYGWWIHKSEDGDDFIASAFAIYRGTAPTVNIARLQGSATYTGGAVGKYTLHSTTDGTNDAGHFTARAMLEADFGNTHSISGTIDNFMGTDGMARD